MHLKKIELHGFKSFADRSVIEFQPGITGIVGLMVVGSQI